MQISGYYGDIKNIEIPNRINGLDVTDVRVEAFWGCTSLETLKISADINVLTLAFGHCTNLRKVTAAKSCKYYYGAFAGCSNLKEVNIPDDENNITDALFTGCDNLLELSVPKSVSYISEYAFGDDVGYTNSGFTLHVYKNSFAEEFAKKVVYKL